MTLRTILSGLTAALVTLSLGGAALAKRGDQVTDDERAGLMKAQDKEKAATSARKRGGARGEAEAQAHEAAADAARKPAKDKVLNSLGKGAKKQSAASRLKEKRLQMAAARKAKQMNKKAKPAKAPKAKRAPKARRGKKAQ